MEFQIIFLATIGAIALISVLVSASPPTTVVVEEDANDEILPISESKEDFA